MKSNSKSLKKASSRVNPTAAFELVEVSTAIDWLENHNDINRHKRPTLVEKYTRERVNKDYLVGYHAIAFDYNNQMLNGQHSCQAIVDSGIPETHLIVRGLDPLVRMIGDTDAPRRPADILKLLGHHATTWDVAIVRQLMNGFHRRATMTEIVKAYEIHEGTAKQVIAMFPWKKKKHLTMSTILASIARALILGYDRDDLERFANLLYHGMAKKPRRGDQSVILFRDYLLSLPALGEGMTREIYRIAQTVLYAYLNNQAITKLVPADKELFPLEVENDHA